jgi:hypothetical protein
MPVDHLASTLLDSAEITLPGLDVIWVNARSIVVVSRVQSSWVPVRIVVDDIAEPVSSVWEWLSIEKDSGADDLWAGLEAGVNEISLCVQEWCKDSLDSLHLNRRKTARGVGGALGTGKSCRIILAEARILNDTVNIAIKRVTLLQNVPMNHDPLRHCDESGRVGGPRDGVEVSAPGCQVVEGNCRRSSNNTVEIVREVLSGLETLSSASRAAKIVRLVVCLAIEIFADLLSHHYTSVKSSHNQYTFGSRICKDHLRSVCKVLYHLWLALKWLSTRAIVSVIGSDGGESKSRGVRQVGVVNTTVQSTIASRQKASGPV